MRLDTNEKLLIEKLVKIAELLDASQHDIEIISSARNINRAFIKYVFLVFRKNKGYDLELTAVRSWRDTLDDDDVLYGLDDWILWKQATLPNHPLYH